MTQKKNKRHAAGRPAAALLLSLMVIITMIPTVSFAEDAEIPGVTGIAADLTYPDGFTPSIPIVVITVDGGQKEIDAMNDDEDHNYRCTGKMDILVPEGFTKYVDSADVVTEDIGLELEYIRGRGNTTWRAEGKKPYKVKLDKKTSLLGMGKNKNWALLANVYDPSLLRNRITYWLGRELGVPFTPECCPVDFFIGSEEDGYQYGGSYILSQIAKNITDIDEPDENDTDAQKITGGYLMSIIQDEGAASVFTTARGQRLQNVTPSFDPAEGDYENETQMNYIRGYVREAEDAIFNGEIRDSSDPSGYRSADYRDYVDVESAATYFLIQLFSANADAYETGSTYFYKTRDSESGEKGKIFWGPLWDFDFGWNHMKDPDDDILTVMPWMTAMMADQSEGAMPDMVLDKWQNELRPALQEIIKKGGILDQYYEEMKTSQASDYRVNHDRYDPEIIDLAKDYKAAVEDLRTWISKRIRNMDAYLAENAHDYAYPVHLKLDARDEHPQTTYVRKGFPFNSGNAPYIVPEKEGYIFLGWYLENGELIDGNILSEETTATAKFIKTEDATSPDDIYFSRDKVYKTLEQGIHSSSFTQVPWDVQNRKKTWTSSDESIATVDGEGMVTFLKTGTVTISVTIPNGKTRSYTLTILDKFDWAESLEVPEKTITMEVGDVRVIDYNIRPESADYYASFTSEDPEVADIDYNGVIFAKKPGETIIKFDVTGYDGLSPDGMSYNPKNFEDTVKVVVTEKSAGGDPKPYSECEKDSTCPIVKFSDSDPKAWYHDGVHWALEKGIMNGTGETAFAPSGTTTRGMIVTMLWRMEGEPEAKASAFTDLTQDWYIPAVNWAAESGIVNGYSSEVFGPDDPITREQLAAILYRYDGVAESDAAIDSSYTDAGDISDWAADAMAWCVAKGIINGMTETTLEPRGRATRAQVATMLMRCSTLDE